MKIIKIKDCYECKHVLAHEVESPVSTEKYIKHACIYGEYRELHSSIGIPEWCELEDYKD